MTPTRLAAMILAVLAGSATLSVAALPAYAGRGHQPAAGTAADTPTPEPPPTPSAPPTPTPSPESSPSTTPATPAPSITPAPGIDPTGGLDEDGCSFFAVGCKAKKAINGWFKDLVKSAINPTLGKLGETLLATPRLDEMPRIKGMHSGSLVVANTCFVLLVVLGGLIVMGHQTLQTSYTIKEIAPRLVVGIVASNASLLLIGKAIEFANGLSAALVGQGVDPEQTGAQLSKIILHLLNPSDVAIFFVLVALVAVAFGTILMFIHIFRIMLTILLIAAAPLALACHALPQTEAIAHLWWKAFGGVLAIQVAQALTFITAMRVIFTSDMVTIFGQRLPGDQLALWITVCLLYVLVRIPAWISRLIWRGGMRSSPIARTAKTAAMLVLFKGVLGKGAGAKAAATSKPAPRPAPVPAPVRNELPPPGPQPRWARPDQRWTPPDPKWHERVHRGRPDPDSVSQQQRWGHPKSTWTPPYAGSWRQQPQPQRRTPPSPPRGTPDPHRQWNPPR